KSKPKSALKLPSAIRRLPEASSCLNVVLNRLSFTIKYSLMNDLKLIASAFVESGTILLRLNGQLILEGGGRVEVDLEKGQHYQLSWEVKGAEGSTYSMTVSSPREAELHLSKRVAGDKER